MALQQISRIVSTSGDTWADLVTGAATVTSLVLANKGITPSRVGVRIYKANATSSLIVPGDELAGGASARLRLPAVVLEAGDKLQVRSLGGVDWTASGATV
ncbi:hypothetical protein FOZ76_11675 [Verticiella sediminum]|uniref:Uncharacterized protein n=1 Tax=Verticiella sediminum TaxID=1247510 RepID=A0A556APJ7_9BURK|nr:hypothetical protein [Verticiella sediminum]TSH94796.1 hypothetical protein FOZ76_11675 [Verticiella sediminum]